MADDAAIDQAHYVALRTFPMDLEGDEFMGPMWTNYLEEYARFLEVDEESVPEAIEHLRNEYVTGWLWTRVIEGSAAGLAALAATGVPVGIVSNADGTIEERLLDLEICQVGPGPGVEVSCVVDSGAVGIEKPNPAIFGFALDALDLPPEGVWYIGDTPAFDVVGARRAGLSPILIDPFGVNGDFDVPTVPSLAAVASSVSR